MRNNPVKAVCVRGCITFLRKTSTLERTLIVKRRKIETRVVSKQRRAIELSKLTEMVNAHYKKYKCYNCIIAR